MDMSRFGEGSLGGENINPTKYFDEYWSEIQVLEITSDDLDAFFKKQSIDPKAGNNRDANFVRRHNALTIRIHKAVRDLGQNLGRSLTIGDLSRLNIQEKFGDPQSDQDLREIIYYIFWGVLDRWASENRGKMVKLSTDQPSKEIEVSYKRRKVSTSKLDCAWEYLENEIVKRISAASPL